MDIAEKLEAIKIELRRTELKANIMDRAKDSAKLVKIEKDLLKFNNRYGGCPIGKSLFAICGLPIIGIFSFIPLLYSSLNEHFDHRNLKYKVDKLYNKHIDKNHRSRL